jgi:hypothetical protein
MPFTSLLLPIVSIAVGAPPKEIASGDAEQIETALNFGVRSAIEHGWAVADIRSENGGVIVTITKGDETERHIASFETNAYLVERPATRAANLEVPNDFTLGALGAMPGGLEFRQDCGRYFERAYIIDAASSDRGGASLLVARTLATASDLERVSEMNGRVTFTLDDGMRDLIVSIGPEHRVVAAELRHYEASSDQVTYQRTGSMKRALGKARVIAIESEDSAPGLTLRTTKGRFVIDPNGDAFKSNSTDEDGEDGDEAGGCGC